MTATLTLTAVSGSEVLATLAGFSTGTISLYHTTNSTYGTASPPDVTNWTDTELSRSGNGTVSIHNQTAGTTHYYLAVQGETKVSASVTLSDAAEIKSGQTIATLSGLTADNQAIVQNGINNKRSTTVDNATSGKHGTLIWIESANEITDTIATSMLVDSDVATLIGASPRFQILAADTIPTLSGQTAYVDVTAHLKFKAST